MRLALPWHKVYQQSPAAALLRSTIRGTKQNSASLTKDKRVHLTSPLLAETIFKQFDLSDYKGCQIVDMNPGFGIYSAFLNAAVQPSKHILLEPKAMFSPIMNILRHTHPSYDYHQLDGQSYEVFDELVKKGIISAPKTAHDAEVNKSLLISCCLPPDILGRRLLFQLVSSIATRSWFQSFGRIRMLVWCDESDRQTFIPRTMSRRKKAAVVAEFLVDCQELVGGLEASMKKKNILEMFDASKRIEQRNSPIDVVIPRGHSLRKDGSLRIHGYASKPDSPSRFVPRPEDVLTYYKMPKEPKTIFATVNDFYGLPENSETTPCLISFTPRVPPSFLTSSKNYVNTWEILDAVLRRLNIKSRTPLSESISVLGPGAATIFETDAELMKTDIKYKRCMDLTLDEFALLIQAYERWPFKDIATLYDDWQDPLMKYDKNQNHQNN